MKSFKLFKKGKSQKNNTYGREQKPLEIQDHRFIAGELAAKFSRDLPMMAEIFDTGIKLITPENVFQYLSGEDKTKLYNILVRPELEKGYLGPMKTRDALYGMRFWMLKIIIEHKNFERLIQLNLDNLESKNKNGEARETLLNRIIWKGWIEKMYESSKRIIGGTFLLSIGMIGATANLKNTAIPSGVLSWDDATILLGIPLAIIGIYKMARGIKERKPLRNWGLEQYYNNPLIKHYFDT